MQQPQQPVLDELQAAGLLAQGDAPEGDIDPAVADELLGAGLLLPEPTFGEHVGEFFKSFARGAAEQTRTAVIGTTQPVQSALGELAGQLGLDSLSDEILGTPAQYSDTAQALGRAVEALPADPRIAAEGWLARFGSQTLPELSGSLVPLVGSGILAGPVAGPAAAGIVGAASGGESSRERAEAAGASQADVAANTAGGAVIGALDVLGGGGAFMRAGKATLKRELIGGAASGFGSNLADQLLVKATYGPDIPVDWRSALEEGLAEVVGGGALHGLGKAAQRAAGPSKADQEAQTAEAARRAQRTPYAPEAVAPPVDLDPESPEHEAARSLVRANSRDSATSKVVAPPTPGHTFAAEVWRQRGLEPVFVDAGSALDLPAVTLPGGRVAADVHADPFSVLAHEAHHVSMDLLPSAALEQVRLIAKTDPQGLERMAAAYETTWDRLRAPQAPDGAEGEAQGPPRRPPLTEALRSEEGAAFYIQALPGYLKAAFESPESLTKHLELHPGVIRRAVDRVVTLVNKALGTNLSTSQSRALQALRSFAETGIERSLDPRTAARLALNLRAQFDLLAGVKATTQAPAQPAQPAQPEAAPAPEAVAQAPPEAGLEASEAPEESAAQSEEQAPEYTPEERAALDVWRERTNEADRLAAKAKRAPNEKRRRLSSKAERELRYRAEAAALAAPKRVGDTVVVEGQRGVVVEATGSGENQRLRVRVNRGETRSPSGAQVPQIETLNVAAGEAELLFTEDHPQGLGRKRRAERERAAEEREGGKPARFSLKPAEDLPEEPPEGYVRFYRGVNPKRRGMLENDPNRGRWFTTNHDEAVAFANFATSKDAQESDGSEDTLPHGLLPGRALQAIDIPLHEALRYARDLSKERGGQRAYETKPEDLLDPQESVHVVLPDDALINRVHHYFGDRDVSELGTIEKNRGGKFEKESRQQEEGGESRFSVRQTETNGTGQSGFDVPDDSRAQWFRRTFVNDLDRAEVIEDAAPKKPRLETAKQAGQLYPGRQYGEVEEFRAKVERPMLRVLKDSGIHSVDSRPGMPSASDWLYALAAPQANATLMALHPRKFGAQANPGSGMTNSEAARIRSEALASPQRAAYLEIQRLNRQTNRTRLDAMVSGGLINAQQRATLEAKWGPDYVPLRTDQDPLRPLGMGAGFTVSGPGFKKRKGRASKADSPLVFAMQTAEGALVLKERNRYGNTLAQLVVDNPDPGLWRIETDSNRIRSDEHALSYMEQGERRWIVTSDAGLHDAFKRMQTDPGVLKVIDPLLNALHSMIIKYNPVFPVTNMAKDIGTVTFKNLILKDAGFAAKVAANAIPAARGAWRAIRNESAQGRWADAYRRARKAGALVGWSEQFDFQGRLEQFRAATDSGQAAQAIRFLAEAVDNMNRAVELGTRIAMFDASLRAGASEAEAAVYARKGSADFAQRGTATPVLRRLYMFFGANVQGTREIVSAVQQKPKRAAALVGSLVAAGYFSAVLSRIFSDYDEENGVPMWDTLSDYQKSHRMGVMVGDTHYGVPASWGWNVFWYLGTQVEAAQHGGADPAMVAGRMVTSVIDAFSPIQGSSVIQAITPTLGRPLEELVENRDFAGNPIMPEADPYDRTPKPDSERAFRSVNPQLQAAARFLNKATGGNELRSGWADFSPETMEHLIKFGTGGVGTNVGRLTETSRKVAAGEEVRVSDWPLLRAFAGQPSPNATVSIYYDNLTDVLSSYEEMRLGLKPKSEALGELGPFAADIQNAVSKLRKAGDAAPGNKAEAEALMKSLMGAFNREVLAAKRGGRRLQAIGGVK